MTAIIQKKDEFEACDSLRAVRWHTLDAHDELRFGGAGSAVSFVLDGALLYSDTTGG